jgi:hypothetical protein
MLQKINRIHENIRCLKVTIVVILTLISITLFVVGAVILIETHDKYCYVQVSNGYLDIRWFFDGGGNLTIPCKNTTQCIQQYVGNAAEYCWATDFTVTQPCLCWISNGKVEFGTHDSSLGGTIMMVTGSIGILVIIVAVGFDMICYD